MADRTGPTSPPLAAALAAALVAACAAPGGPPSRSGEVPPPGAGDTEVPRDVGDARVPPDRTTPDSRTELGEAAEEYVWDDSRLGERCERLLDDCGAGNLCLADITCGPPPDPDVDPCTRWGEDDPDHYRCQRKCTADAHCADLGRHCVAWTVGNGENDHTSLCIALCMPMERLAPFSPMHESCATSRDWLARMTGAWPPPP